MGYILDPKWVSWVNSGVRKALGQSSGGNGNPPAGVGLLPSSAKTIRIKNNSGAAVVAGGVLGLDGSLITPTITATNDNLSHFRNQVVFKGITPTIATHFQSFSVAAQPIGVSGYGIAYVEGTFPAKVNIVNANHLWANVSDSSAASLKSAGSGMARILYKETGTGVKYAIVQLNLATHRIPVALTQDSGSAGTSSTECSFTYTAKTLDAGDTIATAVALIGHRPVNAAMTAATYGELGKDAANVWKIFWCDERITSTVCNVP